MKEKKLTDCYKRVIDYVRISIIDGCNLACTYCMPNGNGCKKITTLSKEEIVCMGRAFANCGIKKIKLTGGEPLLHKDIISIVKELTSISGIDQVTLTTNGILLENKVKLLKEAGIFAINVSLDTLDEEEYKHITGQYGVEKVLNSIKACVEHNIPVKINCVPMKGYNHDSYIRLVELAKKYPVDVRFIEMMPIGYGKNFMPVKQEEIEEKLKSKYGMFYPYHGTKGNGPATYIQWKETENSKWKGNVGFISAVSHEFCDSCNRVRVTSDGVLKLCLCFGKGIDLKKYINESDLRQLEEVIKQGILEKPKHHNFNTKDGSLENEQKNMWEIGG